MGIGMKPDVSYLFSNMGNNATSNLLSSNFLTDYASIKSGSYGKLIKAYYSNTSGVEEKIKKESTNKTNKTPASATATATKQIASVKSASDELKTSALKLIGSGKDSLFVKKDIVTKNEDGTETVTNGYDMNALYKSVSEFANSYNNLLSKAEDSKISSISDAVKNMTNITKLYSKTLSNIGISIDEDNKLVVDEKVFKAADGDKVKEAFNGSHSFASSVSSQASFVNSAATREATKANTYTGTGNYGNNFSAGDLFSSLF